MNTIRIRRYDLTLLPRSERVILRSFIPSDPKRIATILGRALALSEEDVARDLGRVSQEFQYRHFDSDTFLMAQYEKVLPHVFTQRPLSLARKLLIGALFSGEYALESAALFNPAIVPHPDQSELEPGSIRFVLSLRATGEGHISSIEFRSGVFSASGKVTLDLVSGFVITPECLPNPQYQKKRFMTKLYEMGFENEFTAQVMTTLGTDFSRNELKESMREVRQDYAPLTRELRSTLDCIQWLADSNYEVEFSSKTLLSERIIFPISANESNGIEDARFVQFVEDDGEVTYYATYTAYNGHSVLPQFIETKDFLSFKIRTLNGEAVQNKGMALFPRRINGRYAMLSRQDDENLFILFSDNLHYWSDPKILMRPSEIWESVKLGNCGSPIETEAGWIVITHGVGPMRKYCIGVALLDLHDPTKVVARLSYPILEPTGHEREGYVPNVVYSCGSMLHGRNLIVPYALGDRITVIASISLDELLSELLKGNNPPRDRPQSNLI